MASTIDLEEGRDRMISVELIEPLACQSLYMSDMYWLLCDIIGLRVKEVEGIQVKTSNLDGYAKSFEVKISSMEVWQRVGLDDYIGKSSKISYNRTIRIDRPYENLTHVIVKGVPMFWTKAKLEKLFNWYGRVKILQKDHLFKI